MFLFVYDMLHGNNNPTEVAILLPLLSLFFFLNRSLYGLIFLYIYINVLCNENVLTFTFLSIVIEIINYFMFMLLKVYSPIVGILKYINMVYITYDLWRKNILKNNRNKLIQYILYFISRLNWNFKLRHCTSSSSIVCSCLLFP